VEGRIILLDNPRQTSPRVREDFDRSDQQGMSFRRFNRFLEEKNSLSFEKKKVIVERVEALVLMKRG
jgi:uncharacterized protein Smg (DUF494 family)